MLTFSQFVAEENSNYRYDHTVSDFGFVSPSGKHLNGDPTRDTTHEHIAVTHGLGSTANALAKNHVRYHIHDYGASNYQIHNTPEAKKALVTHLKTHPGVTGPILVQVHSKNRKIPRHDHFYGYNGKNNGRAAQQAIKKYSKDIT